MSFERIESFDYSTENMDNESIQDKIDAKTLEISQLTKESLKELKVDIQNENSSLTLRDNDGNYLGKVRDNEVLIYEGEAKPVEYKGSQKLFLKVRTKTGKVGFVSADYLKAKVNQDKIHVEKAANDGEIKAPVAPIKQEEAKKETNSKKEEKSTTIEGIQEKNNQQQTKEVSGEKNKELETVDKNKTNNIETLSNITVGGLDAYSKADKFSGLDIGNNVEVSREMVNFQQNIESLQNYHEKINNPHIQLLLTVLPIWTDAARQKAQEQWSMGGLIDDKEKILAYISNVESNFNTLINKQGEIDYKNEINNIFSDILKAENDEEDIIDNIEDVQKILLNTSEKSVEDDKATILKLMAGSIATDGNTKKVLEFTRNEIIKNSPEIKEKIEQILNIESFESIDAQYFINLGLNSEQAKDLVSDLEEKRTEIYSYSTQQRELFKTEILKHQPELSGQDLTDRIDDAINASVHMRLRDLSIQGMANNLIHNSQSNDSFTTLYKDLDSFSQSAGEWLGDNLAMIVVSLIPMGAAFTVVGLAGKVGRAAYLGLQASKFTKIQTVGNIVGHTGKAATFGRNMVKGAIFYEALNATNNGLYLDKNQDWTEMFNGWDDASEVLKMSLTFGIFGMLQKSLKIIPEGQTLKSTANKELFKRGITALSAEGAAFSGIEVGIDFTQGELKTWEEYIEVFASGVLMGATFRGVEAMPKKQRITPKDVNSSNIQKSERKNPSQKESVKNNNSDLENITVTLDETTGLIKFDGGKYQIISNNSFYFTSPKNGKLYRIETGDKGQITKVFNTDTSRNPNQSLDGKEYSLSGSAKWAVIKNNINEIRNNYSVKIDRNKSQPKDTKSEGFKEETKDKKSEKKQSNKETLVNNNSIQLIEKEVIGMKNGTTINFGEYKLSLKNKEYTLEGPNGYKKDFRKKESVLSALDEKLPKGNERLNILLKNGQEKIKKELDNLSKLKDGFEIDGKIIRLKKDGDTYYFQEKNGNNGFKEMDIKSLSEKQIVEIHSKLGTKKLLQNIRNVFDKITPDDLFSKMELNTIAKKYGENTKNKILSKSKDILKGIKDGGKMSKDVLFWFLRGKKGAVFSYKSVLGGIMINEALEAQEDFESYTRNFFSLDHGLSILGNAFMAKQVGIIRSVAYNEIIEAGIEGVTGENI